MDENSIIQFCEDAFRTLQIAESNGNYFLYHGPDGVVPEKTFPFATLVTSDAYDAFSDLNRPSVFRLNVGVARETFRTLFGEAEASHDFTALDRVMPHPVYGKMFWVCVLNPSRATFESAVRPLLEEAYITASAKQA